MLQFPAPLRRGDRVGVTSPSAGVKGPGADRIDFCVRWLREAGFDVVVGDAMDGAGITAGPAGERAAELTAMLCDPTIRCVLPPWGGETAIDLVDLLDWDALAAAEPTWLVGFSDLSTLLLPITTRLGWATLHGDNLADTPYAVPDGLLSWLDIAAGPGPHRQRDSGLVADWWRFAEDPRATQWKPVGDGRWTLHGADSLHVTGRLHRRLRRDAVQPGRHAVRRCVGVWSPSTPRTGSSSTSRRPRTRRPRSAATCTACGWPAGSSTRERSWSAGRTRRTTRS